jgi:hypothetical protein
VGGGSPPARGEEGGKPGGRTLLGGGTPKTTAAAGAQPHGPPRVFGPFQTSATTGPANASEAESGASHGEPSTGPSAREERTSYAADEMVSALLWWAQHGPLVISIAAMRLAGAVHVDLGTPGLSLIPGGEQAVLANAIMGLSQARTSDVGRA